MSNMTIKEIRMAIVAELAPLKASHGVKNIEGYNGQFGNYLDLAKKQSNGVVWPFLFVSFIADTTEYFEEGTDKKIFQFAIQIGVKKTGGQGAAEEEAVDIMDAATPILHNQLFGLDLPEPSQVKTRRMIATDKGLCIYSIDLRVAALDTL